MAATQPALPQPLNAKPEPEQDASPPPHPAVSDRVRFIKGGYRLVEIRHMRL
jgi:hypothetical protein